MSRPKVPGSGRPKTLTEPTRLTIWIDAAMLETLKSLARWQSITLAELIRRFLKDGVSR